ncbi:MAG: thr operon leader peptide [Nitrosopumilaceae archaeon]
MNKHTIIVIIASFVIAGPFVFAAMNIYAAEQVQFAGIEQERFNYFDMINDREIKVCNPSPFYAVFNKINIIMIFDQKDKGILSLKGTTLSPLSITTLEGKFTSETFEEVQYLSMHFDGMFSGTTPMRIDQNKFDIVTEISTPIIGMIPYSNTQQYSGLDFWNMMNDKDRQFSC